MEQAYIEIKGARENNLKNISLSIPKRKITVFTGVSGSGKSSIVFETIGAEAQRQLNETFSTFVRNRLPRYTQPDADSIENLSTAIVIDQKRLGGNSRSTVGTITDIYAVLRLLFSRIGNPFVGYSNIFSFNDPAGMCPECNGLGETVKLNLDKFLDRSKSLNEGAILFPMFAVGSWYFNTYAYSNFFDNDKKLNDYSEEEWRLLLHGKPKKFQVKKDNVPLNVSFEGLVDKFNRMYIKRDTSILSESTRVTLERFISFAPCPLCKGTRLNQTALNCKIDGYNIADLTAMQVDELIDIIANINDRRAGPMVADLKARIQHLIDIGLGYLSLDQSTTSLSGGESQRIKMVRHLGSSLTDMIYIFDEPSIGLHPRDVHRLNELLLQLRDKGNTVLVVEHDPEVIKIADHIVDIGPNAGTHGGEIVYEGTVAGLMEADTLTGKFMDQKEVLKTNYRLANGFLKISNASLHNLKDVTVDIPKDVLTVVTGVAGSGKSTLINEVFAKQHPGAILIDQSAVSTSIRSNPATYTGIMDDIRRLFAQENNVSASLFSFNSKGACPNCQGLGFIYTDLAFLEPVKTPCEICGSKRFKEEVLNYKLKGKSISDVLEMTVQDAVDFFDKRDLKRRLQAIHDVGLDYLTLGQPLNTLSGGECQRIKLAGNLHKKGSVYVLDEPTTGLHMSDVGHLLKIVGDLVDSGNSVIVIEHNLSVIKNADWIIDMGPDGGKNGGEIVFTGTPSQIINVKDSLTGQYLKRSN
ncbi:excinuclease ABC subunit UvrA [Pedobacter nyackensis]|uniref:excinuclease ABC subunit UvrA n=1 Tax=Pedobacter nyackensis TaxID=475255 RepID=UPI00292EEE40|nr:excinuclease ABC subunit UvrA [Pedobacter nyackensis]